MVLGLGNPILSDDGVGIYVVRAVAAQCQLDDVTFTEASVGGLRLLDVIAGYERVIVVDAIQTRTVTLVGMLAATFGCFHVEC